MASSCNCLTFSSHEIYNKNFLDYQLQNFEAIDDFAGLLTAEKRNLSDQEKFQLLTKDYTSSEKFVFPKTKIYGKKRSFQMSWVKEYTWLVYSPSKDGGLCRVCLVFPPSSNVANTGTLVCFAMTRFHKANEILKSTPKRNITMTPFSKPKTL